MTRKDYPLISSALRAAKPADSDMGFREGQHVKDCTALADALLQDNPHGFDRARFLKELRFVTASATRSATTQD